MFPISSLYVFVAVSKPNEVSIASFFKSPSIVLGTPITLVEIPLFTKCSAKRAAFVLESSPPTTTSASSAIRVTVCAAAANWDSLSILVRPEPMRSKPPVLRYASTRSAHISI